MVGGLVVWGLCERWSGLFLGVRWVWGGVLGRRWGGRAGLRLGWWGFTYLRCLSLRSEDSHYFIDDGSDVPVVLVV